MAYLELYNNDVNHKLYKFESNASIALKNARIILIPENQRVDYKYCKICNICYKKSYFKNHKKNKFHLKKLEEKKDVKKKYKTEYSLVSVINKSLSNRLINNDLNIGNVIQSYLVDVCSDCNMETINPDYIYRNNIETNVCQHCRSKYHNCHEKCCTLIGKYFMKCKNCKKYGCSKHLKALEGKSVYCKDCLYKKIDNLFN